MPCHRGRKRKARATGVDSERIGGGIHVQDASPTISHNTIRDNYATLGGGGIALVRSNAILADNTIVSTILWDNSPEQIYVDEFATLTVAYTDLQGGQAGIVIEGSPTLNNAGGNLNADPRFVDAANGGYQLQANSPAIDAGTAFFQWNGRVIVDLNPDQYTGAAPDVDAFGYGGTGTANQPPVAVASADPTRGSAPLAVRFSADGSSDPDGTIVAYSWGFGDGATTSEAYSAHTFGSPGSYNVSLTVTDNGGATGSDTVVVTVTQAAQNAVHVHDQTVVRVKVRNTAAGQDTVLIADQDSVPDSGALVIARYTGPTEGQVTGTTGADGTATLQTSWARRAKDTWCFEVIGVSKGGYVYDPAANIVTTQCEAP